MASEIVEDCSSHDPLLDVDSLDISSGVKSDEYLELQFRVFRLTILLTIFSVGIVGFFLESRLVQASLLELYQEFFIFACLLAELED